MNLGCDFMMRKDMMLVLRLQHQLRTTGLENVLEEVKLQEPLAACWLHWEEPAGCTGRSL